MHCPACGAEFTSGLRYCKRCGGNLFEPVQPATQGAPLSASRVTGAAWAIALASTVITLGGLGIVFTHAFDLMKPLGFGVASNGNPMPIAIVMLALGSTTIFGVVALLIRLFTRLLTAPAPEASAPVIKSIASAPAYPQLGATPSSVTEHTTRTFRPPVYDEAQARE
jgi:hypothetical protein